MTNQHLIMPSPEQVDEWFNDAVRLSDTPKYYIARQAALWSADQELEACCEWLREFHPGGTEQLRCSRRPQPPSLKEQALAEVAGAVAGGNITPERGATIRRALEALDD